LRFVIDLNVFHSAWTGKNPNGIPDEHSAILLLRIVEERCKIIVTKEIEKKYWNLFQRLKNQSPQGPRSLNVINLYLRAKQMGIIDNTRRSSDLPPLPDETHIKDEDKDLARLANLTDAVLVTYDEPLIKAVKTQGVTACKPDDKEVLMAFIAHTFGRQEPI
jgi:predicted nucleic acid-binding protein